MVGSLPGDYGGGIASFNSSLTISSSTFTGNTARDGAAISAIGDSTLTISSSVIKNNQALENLLPDPNDFIGGTAAVFAINGNNVNISSSTISNNSGFYGGLLVTGNNDVIFNSNTVDNNVSVNTLFTAIGTSGTGGFEFAFNTNVSVTNNIVSGNIGYGSTATGGGFVGDYNDVVSGNLFSNNESVDTVFSQSCGGGLGITHLGTFIPSQVELITHNIFINNVADYGGAILSVADPILTITDNLFINNIARVAGGAISTGNTNPTFWPELFGPSGDGNVNISQNVFTGNHAGTGGAIASAQDTSITLNQNVFISNTATYGGAINDASSDALSIADDIFAGNSATQGNSIWLDGGQTAINGLTVTLTLQTVLIAQLVNDNINLFSDDIYIG